ncbi:MAG: M48 family metalloprotease [Abditibacteriota bacterium]|nr:M48 family metalloprotease [Abditibacteriota bacterium]
MKKILISILSILALSAMCAFAASSEIEIGEPEVQMGKEAAAETAKTIKVVADEAVNKRVKTIGEKLAKVANETEIKAFYGTAEVVPFEYNFTVIEDKEVNAYSLPGGFIYVHTGLIDFVQSDDELAGVLAHEVTHAAHHHMVYLLKQQEKVSNVTTAAMLAAMLLGGGSDSTSNLILGMQLFQIAKVNGYGMNAERDADYAAIDYMIKAGYNPVGLLTFLERLAKDIEFVDYGIYRNHPIDAERVASAKRIITEKGIDINRRQTTKAICAEVKTEGGKSTVTLQGSAIYVTAAEDKANATAKVINELLDAKVKAHEIKLDGSGGVFAKGKTIANVTDEDAKLMNDTKANAAKNIQTAIKNVLFSQMLETMH